MASVKVVLRTSKKPNKDGKCPFHLRLIHNRKVRYKSLGIALHPSRYNKNQRNVKLSEPKAAHFNSLFRQIEHEGQTTADLLVLENPNITIDQLKKIVFDEKDEDDLIAESFIHFGRKMVKTLEDEGKIRYGNRCGYVIDKLEDFTNGHLPFKDMDIAFLRRFKTYLIKEKKNSVNTAYGNFKVMKTFYRQAIMEGYASQGDNPFFLFTMGTEPVHKDHLELDHIKALMRMEFTGRMSHPVYRLTRDSFLLSFWCAGIRFSDIAKLKWSNIINGTVLDYVMGKTKGRKTMELSPAAVAILDGYRRKVKTIDGYVFPWIDEPFEGDRGLIRMVSKANARANKALKVLAEEIGFSGNLTFHTSRHSFTSIADEVADLSVKELQSLLGHSDSRTTEIYRNSLSTGKDKKAMTKFYEAMKKTGV